MLEGLLLSGITGSQSAQIDPGKLEISKDDDNLLNTEEFSVFFLGQLPQQSELRTASALLRADGQSLPISRTDGMALPLKTIESILNRLSDPVQVKRSGLTEQQIAVIKDVFGADLTSINPAMLKEKMNELFSAGSLKNSKGVAHQIGRVSDSSVFRDAIMSMVKSDTGQSGFIDTLFNTSNYSQLLAGNSVAPQPGNSITIDATQAPLSNQVSSHEQVAKPGNYIQTVSVDTQLGRPQWAEAFNSRVLLLTQDQVQSAHIKLNPAELGPIEIRLSSSKDQTHIHFIAQHSEVRDVIQDALPRLRDMMGQSGVDLGDVNVSQHSASGQEYDFQHELSTNRGMEGLLQQHDDEQQTTIAVRVQKGLVDETV